MNGFFGTKVEEGVGRWTVEAKGGKELELNGLQKTDDAVVAWGLEVRDLNGSLEMELNVDAVRAIELTGLDESFGVEAQFGWPLKLNVEANGAIEIAASVVAKTLVLEADCVLEVVVDCTLEVVVDGALEFDDK